MKPHRTDNVSLFFGLLFIVIAGAFMAREYLDVSLPAFGWFIAGAAIIFGVLGIVGVLVPRRPSAPAEVTPQPETQSEPQR